MFSDGVFCISDIELLGSASRLIVVLISVKNKKNFQCDDPPEVGSRLNS
jgi:hypothetical protein